MHLQIEQSEEKINIKSKKDKEDKVQLTDEVPKHQKDIVRTGEKIYHDVQKSLSLDNDEFYFKHESGPLTIDVKKVQIRIKKMNHLC